jgi:hypothetical protein
VTRSWRGGSSVAALVVASIMAGGCAATPSTAPSAAPTVEPASQAAPAATLEPSLVPEPTPTLPTLVDPSLLAILPQQIAGSTVEEDVEGERDFGADPGSVVRRYAAAVVGDAGENIASASIAAVASADMAAFFPAWRADYDAAACAPTGGVDDTSLADIGGRQVEMTACASGVRLYHLRLRDGSLVLSISSVGPADFGTKLIEGLRE